MFEIFRGIISNPIWTATATISSWLLIYSFLKWISLTDKNWKRLEYVWIFTGLIGVIGVIEKNNKDFNSFEAYWAKKRIADNLSRLEYLLEERSCLEFTKIDSSPTDLQDRQMDQDLICEWSKKYDVKIDSTGVPLDFLDTQSVRRIQFRTDFMDQYVKDFLECSNDLNQEISNYRTYRNEIESHFFDDFERTYGILLLILAAGVKLSITTNSIKNSS